MKRKILGFLICCILVLGMTGCGTEVKDQKVDSNIKENKEDKKEKSETFKVGNYNIRYGFYKSDKNSILIKKNGTIWMQNGISYDYTIRDNYIVFKNGEYEYKYRVEAEDYIVYETNDGEDYDTLYYFKTADEAELIEGE